MRFSAPIDRRAAADHVGVAEGLRARHFDAAQRPGEKLIARVLIVTAVGNLSLERDDERLLCGEKISTVPRLYSRLFVLDEPAQFSSARALLEKSFSR